MWRRSWASGTVVLIACDPSDSFLDGLDDRVLTFGWDRADLDRIRDDGGLPCVGSQSRWRHLRGRRVVPTPCVKTPPSFAGHRTFGSSGRRSAVAAQLSREAFRLFHDLSGLALP